ncbi:MAG: hypothetical protein HQ558_05450 [Candidatus Omnitrophica bacterium]|nr:hypothetical protein [Candidatus Omnitrophota bacterium]
MRRFLSAVLLCVVALTFTFVDTGFCRREGNLYHQLKRMRVVKVYVEDITDSSEEAKVDAVDLKQELSDALRNRKTVNFEVVDNKKIADIIIVCDVLQYFWKEEDPLDMIMSSVTAVYDMLTVENYAFMEVVFTVINAKKGRKMWSKRMRIDLTKKQMSEADSILLINDRAVKVFLKDCVSKAKAGRRL